MQRRKEPIEEKEPYHFHYLWPSLVEMVNFKGKVVLDIGCRSGYITKKVLGNGADVYGIDIDQGHILILKKDYPQKFFECNIEKDPLPPEIRKNKFDIILATEVIEHLYNPEALVNKVKNILSRNGELIISVPYHGYFKNCIISLVGKWDFHFHPQVKGGHIKFWSQRTLTKFLESNGFRVKEVKGVGRVPFLWKSMVFKVVRNG